MNFPRLKYSLMALIFLILTVTTSAHAASFFEETKKLAEQGNAFAQVHLGVMYRTGKDVPKNDKEAVKWFRKSAEQGTAKAQYKLGIMYALGQGVPENNTLAYKWLNLATIKMGQIGESAQKALDIITSEMTKEQIAEAQKLATEWFKAHSRSTYR